MMRPRVSIVIPTHQTRTLILRCVDSLRAASLQASEIIVVDDGSTDGTAEALRRQHPGVTLVELRPGRGFTVAANVGMRQAQGELRQLALNGADEAVLQEKTAQIGTLMAQGLQLRVQRLQKIGGILTPEQRAKYAQLRDSGPRMMKGGRGHS